MKQKQRDTGLCVPGFRASGIASGIKESGAKDLALIVSETPAAAAAVYTTNRFKAAPVLHSMAHCTSGMLQAIIVNSGCANAATGKEGRTDAAAMARIAARNLGIDDSSVLVASTGAIGARLPIGRIEARAVDLVSGLREEGIEDAAEAIMTTDRFPKAVIRRCSIDGNDVTICGIAKGAGMIEPDMATMLAFFLTDASVDTLYLTRLFKDIVNQSFNAITVDGCMSTNDTAVILANGKAGNRRITGRSRERGVFRDALLDAAVTLATMIVRDGEGATKLIDISVEGARNRAEARRIAYAVGRSNLVKTAFFGGDPNWGRIISAVGAAGVPLRSEALELSFGDTIVFSNGLSVEEAGARVTEILKNDTVRVTIRLDEGNASFRLFASDLSHEYIAINALYHT